MPSGLPALLSLSSSFGFLGQERLAALVVAVLGRADGTDHLLRRDSVDLLGVNAHEILASAGDDVGPVAVGAQVLQHLLHWQIGEVGVRPFPARILRCRQPFLRFRDELSTDMPVSVAASIFSRSCIESFAIAARLPERTVLNGSTFANSGFAFTTAGTRSRQYITCEYIGCSTHSVPSWSKVAMRSGGGTKLGFAWSVVARTKSRIACFAGPSFHDGRVPDGFCASAATGTNALDTIPSAGKMESKVRRSGPVAGATGFISSSELKRTAARIAARPYLEVRLPANGHQPGPQASQFISLTWAVNACSLAIFFANTFAR